MQERGGEISRTVWGGRVELHYCQAGERRGRRLRARSAGPASPPAHAAPPPRQRITRLVGACHSTSLLLRAARDAAPLPLSQPEQGRHVAARAEEGAALAGDEGEGRRRPQMDDEPAPTRDGGEGVAPTADGGEGKDGGGRTKGKEERQVTQIFLHVRWRGSFFARDPAFGRNAYP